ncbi:MAG: DNA polymerase/3'-5' exonuclease PolX [Bacteroidetes bacterium]|nr:MAG: DNA polymerase/3'-5' exonuclease PolX [Bacteroidota bacterium]
MTNKAVARILKETAALVELTGGNPYRARAFSNAARTLERLDEPVEALLERGELTRLRGIGDGLAGPIRDILTRGSFDLRDDLLGSLPPGLLDVLRVKGLGARRARQLWQSLGITSLPELEAAAEAGRLASLDGFGEKSQASILANTRLLRAYDTRRRYADALPHALHVLDRLRRVVPRAEIAGALRRQLETVDEAVFVAVAEAAALPGALDLPDETVRIAPDDPTTVHTRLADGLPARIRCVPAEAFGTAWWRETGSEAHVRAYEAAHGAPPPLPEETLVFERAGLTPIPPELREGSGELEAAARGSLPTLITFEDLQGTLHNHSTYSDGAHSLRAMAEAARAMGLQYFGICDHSQSLKIAGGLSPQRVREQQAEIAALNEAFASDGGPAFRVFSGIEADILADGSLDYDDDTLARFDFVVASVHVGLDMTEDVATERVLRAIRHPATTILGHPTGRLLLSREGYPLDHARVIAACAEHGVAIELNANPYRLDLDWRWIREATRQGVLIAINPDAHSIDGLQDMRWGVAVARKGWLTPEQCLNARSLEAFSAWLDARRSARLATSPR